jgi:hypothetical protein
MSAFERIYGRNWHLGRCRRPGPRWHEGVRVSSPSKEAELPNDDVLCGKRDRLTVRLAHQPRLRDLRQPVRGATAILRGDEAVECAQRELAAPIRVSQGTLECQERDDVVCE